MCQIYYAFFFFKQKTAYEMRISDWSSDVCSSDLQKLSRSLRRESLLGLLGTLAFIMFVGSQVYRQDLGILVIVYALLALGMYLPLALGGRLSLAYNADRKSTRLNSSH